VNPLRINIYRERMPKAELLGKPVPYIGHTSPAGTVLSPAALKRGSTLAWPIKNRFLLRGRKLSLAEFGQERGFVIETDRYLSSRQS